MRRKLLFNKKNKWKLLVVFNLTKNNQLKIIMISSIFWSDEVAIRECTQNIAHPIKKIGMEMLFSCIKNIYLCVLLTHHFIYFLYNIGNQKASYIPFYKNI